MKPLHECRVLVTPTTFGRHDPLLRTRLEEEVGEVIYNAYGRPLTSSELMAVVPRIDGFIAGLDAIDRSVIAAADLLRVIARYGVGVDSVDLEAAREKDIMVTNTPGANSASVGELTIGLMLSLARKIPAATHAVRLGEWPRLSGTSLKGKVIGLLGFGSIGREVARRLSGFDCQILAYDPWMDLSIAEALGVEAKSMQEVIQYADFLSLHCPLTEETKGLVDSSFLKKMKPGAYLINTARGELIDELALLEALKSGRLSGAALDVFSKQPPNSDDPLLASEQVLVSPHMGAHTDEAMNAMGWGALHDCLAVLRGEEPIHRVL
jgi:D-3-phosphoglycerate dehydrogenase / 2-oxoglutarate reductase